MRINSLTLALLSTITLSAVCPTAGSAATSSGQLQLLSDYLYRGISQTNQGPALQGQFSLQQQDWYLTAWGSNITFGDGSLELDLSAGRLFQLTEEIKLDLGLMQYRYPKGDNDQTGYNFIEAYSKLSYQHWTLSLTLTDNYFGAGVGKFAYLTLDWQRQLAEQVQLRWHLGYNSFAGLTDYQAFVGSAAATVKAYTDWSVQVQTSQLGLDWSLALAGTSVSANDCIKLCDTRLVLGLSKTF